MAHHNYKQAACANCHFTFEQGQPDEFCPRCGQPNHAVDISFGHVVEEFLEGIFHFDGKVFNTAKLLLFKPGELTKQFLAGKRVPYVPPIRLYVFISFVFFFLLSLQTTYKKNESLAKRLHAREAHMAADSLARLEKQRAAGAQNRAVATDAVQTEKRKGTFNSKLSYLENMDLERLPADITDQQVDSVLQSKKQELTLFNRLGLRRAVRWRDATMNDIGHQFFRAFSLSMFFLMPLAALLLKGFYWRKQRYYLGHLVFTIHVHCFIFLFFCLLLLLSKVPGVREAVTWIWWLPIPYFILAIHRFYEQSWRKTLFKSVLLGITYCLSLVLCLVFVLSLGLLFF